MSTSQTAYREIVAGPGSIPYLQREREARLPHLARTIQRELLHELPPLAPSRPGPGPARFGTDKGVGWSRCGYFTSAHRLPTRLHRPEMLEVEVPVGGRGSLSPFHYTWTTFQSRLSIQPFIAASTRRSRREDHRRILD